MISIKELSNKILDEYNKNHGPDGRYISGGSASGETLTAEDYKRIDDAAEKVAGSKTFYSNDMVAEVETARNAILKSIGIPPEQIKNVDSSIDKWGGLEGRTKLIVVSNMIGNRAKDSGMDSELAQHYNTNKAKYNIQPAELQAFSAHIRFNQSYMEKKFGSEMELHRGVSGKQAKELGQSTRVGKKVELDINELTSFTKSSSIADKYAKILQKNTTKDIKGVSLKATVNSNQIFTSYATSSTINKWGNDEVIVVGGKTRVVNATVAKIHKMTKSDISNMAWGNW
jgi:hypothetical protein